MRRGARPTDKEVRALETIVKMLFTTQEKGGFSGTGKKTARPERDMVKIRECGRVGNQEMGKTRCP